MAISSVRNCRLSCCKQVVSHSAKDNNNKHGNIRFADHKSNVFAYIVNIMLQYDTANVFMCRRNKWFVDGLAPNIRKRLAFITARRGYEP